MAELMVGAPEDHQRIERMSLTITGGVVKATKKWKQKTRQGSETHFDRFFSVNDMEFNVKLKTDNSNDPFVTIETDSQELFNGYEILIEYCAGGKSGSLTYNPGVGSLSKFESPCPSDGKFRSIFEPNGQDKFEINVTYKVAFEI